MVLRASADKRPLSANVSTKKRPAPQRATLRNRITFRPYLQERYPIPSDQELSMMREWVTLSEAAEWARERFESAGRTLSRKTVSRWALDGKIRAVQKGKRWFVQPQSLMAFVASQLQSASDAASPGEKALTSPPLSEPGKPPTVVQSAPPTAGPSIPPRDPVREAYQKRNARFLRDLNSGID